MVRPRISKELHKFVEKDLCEKFEDIQKNLIGYFQLIERNDDRVLEYHLSNHTIPDEQIYKAEHHYYNLTLDIYIVKNQTRVTLYLEHVHITDRLLPNVGINTISILHVIYYG